MTQLLLSLLGPLRATVDDRPVTAFPTDKVRCLLAFLAMEPGRPHRRDALAGLLWPEWPDDDARRNLRQSLHRLKQTLDSAAPGLADQLLQASQTTVQLDPAALALDVDEFRRLLAEVEAHAHRSLPTCQPCMARLTQAVELYHGELLAGISLPDAATFEEWQVIQREALHYQAVTALQALGSAYEQRGEHGLAHGAAMRLLGLEPWQEDAHRLAMRALALSGQRNEALAHFDLCRRVLEEELGVEPSDETRALYWQIAAGELHDAASMRAGRVELHHFPSQFTPFIGRRSEVRQILDALADPGRRLVTLVGPGGIGKTRLAIEAANQAARLTEDFPDGIYFAPLAEVSDATLLVPALASALGVALDEQQPNAQLLAFLRPKRLLLVLDNFEHLLDPASAADGAALVSAILHTAPDVQFLVTSQSPLELRAEWRIPLDGLDYPASNQIDAAAFEASGAVQLFVQAARQALARPDYLPSNEERAAIVRICQLCHGMPLAIELAAAWVRAFDCATIAGELAQRLDLLATSLRDVPERHRSLRAAFDYAWRLLSPDEQRALARISVFRGGFTRAAASVVAGATMLELTGLLDRSLLARAGDQRFTVHPLVRQLSQDMLAAMGQGAALHAGHAAYFAAWVGERAGAVRASPDQLQTLAAIEEEIENVTAAWRWAIAAADDQALGAMLDALFNFWGIRSRFQEGERHLGEAVGALRRRLVDAVLLARLQGRWAWFLFQGGQIEVSRRLLEESAAALTAAGAPLERAWVLAYLGALLRHQGEYAEAEGVLVEALRLADQAGDDYHVSVALNVLGQVYSLQGRTEHARALLERALDIKRRIGDRWGITFSLSYLGRVAQEEGNYGEAQKLLGESLLLSQEFGDRRGVAFALFNLGKSAQAQGQPSHAAGLYRQSLQIYEDIGSRSDAGRVRRRMAELEG